MTRKPSIDDTILNAYVDGELDAGAAAEVEAWLRDNPDDMRRVQEWRRLSAELKQAFDPVLDAPMPAEWTSVLMGRRGAGWSQWAPRAVAASLVFAVGAASGWYLAAGRPAGPAAPEAIAERALSAHVVYAAEVRHPVEVTVSEKAHLVGWLSNRLGQPLSAPDLSASGYRLMGGRLLADEGKPAAQFMYENDAGRRITLYIAANPGGGETAFQVVEDGAATSLYWLDGPLGFAITGDLTQRDLMPVAHRAYEQLSQAAG